MGKYIDLTGEKYGLLTVAEEYGYGDNTERQWQSFAASREVCYG